MMTLKEALKRIEELEALVRILASRLVEVHHHNDFATPAVPFWQPANPNPDWWPKIICANSTMRG